MLELDEKTVINLSETFENTSWELISPDTPYPDGEAYCVFVYNNGQPFKLVFYGDFTVDYEHNNTIERYKYADSIIHSTVFNVANPDNLGEIYNTLIWCDPESFTNENVWKEHESQHNETVPQS